MQTHHHHLLLAILALNITPSLQAQVLPDDAMLHGKTIGEWTADWWTWMYSIPTNQNPIFDEDGSRTHYKQAGPVFFAPSGPFNVSGPLLTLNYTIPEDRHLLVPIVLSTWDNVDVIPPLTVEELYDSVAAVLQGVTELHAVVDEASIPFTHEPVTRLFDHRAISPVFGYNFTSPDNVYSVWTQRPFVGVVHPIVADGYWLMLEPLSRGAHELQTGATLGFPSFSRSLIHKINVIPDPNQYVLPKDVIVGGRTQEDWSADWHTWAFPCPTNQNPLLDTTGANAHSCQADGPVFFLAGVFLGAGTTSTRTFTVPEGNHLFFPIVCGYAGDPGDPPTVEERRDLLTAFLSSVTDLHASIDGVAITNLTDHRLISPVFAFDLPSCDNMMTVNNGFCISGLQDNLVADGYYLMVKPLPVGGHVLTFGGSFGSLFNFEITTTDHITVVPMPLEDKVDALSSLLGMAQLPAYRTHALQVLLHRARAAFEEDNFHAGIQHLHVFQNLARKRLSSLQPDLAQDLVLEAQMIIDRARLDQEMD